MSYFFFTHLVRGDDLRARGGAGNVEHLVVIERRELPRERHRAQRALVARADGREQLEVALHVRGVERRRGGALLVRCEDAEGHHRDHDLRHGHRLRGEAAEEHLDRRRLRQRVDDAALLFGQRQRLDRVAAVARDVDHPLQVAERAAKDEAVRDRADAVDHQRRRRLQEDALLRRERPRLR